MTLIEIIQNTGGFVCIGSIFIGFGIMALLWRFHKPDPKEGENEQ